MRGDVLSRPDEEWIIDMKGFAAKGAMATIAANNKAAAGFGNKPRLLAIGVIDEVSRSKVGILGIRSSAGFITVLPAES